MKTIFLKSGLVAAGAAVVSVAAAATLVPALGGVVDGNAWMMCILCPLVTAWPASAYTMWQGQRLKRINDELKDAHDELAATHRELAETHKQLAEKARRDDMTGFLNREAFFAALDGSRRKSNRGALLVIDADHFKNINDNFGHLIGDEALQAISAAIARGVRSGDILGRIGGEEFGAYLVGASDAEAAQVAERIRHEVAEVRFRPSKDSTVRLTVNIGGTSCTPSATISELMRDADKRLYQAKHSGRNLAIVAVAA